MSKIRKFNEACRKAASAWGRRRAQTRWDRPREETADSARSRALHDARGIVVREGVTYRGDGAVVPWQVVRSRRGRTDQFDVLAAGRVCKTMGRKRLERAMKART